jgi:mono/diheme cytochrome c family protein
LKVVMVLKVMMILLPIGSFTPLAAAAAGDAAAGKETFRKNCSTCHGLEGAGNGPMAKALKLNVADLSSKEAQSLSDAQIAKVIREGKGNMKPVKGLTDTDIENLIAFIRTLAKK